MRDISDTLSLYGNLSMRVYDVDPNGEKKLLFRFSKKNQITDDGRLTVLQLLAQAPSPPGTTLQGNPAYGQIWSLSVGSGIIPPAASQTGLVAPVWTGALNIALGERVYNAGSFQINVHKTVPVGEADGLTFAEVGLFTRGSLAAPSPITDPWEPIPERKMYSRQIFPSFVKGATMSVVFDWTLGLTVA